MSTFTVTNSEQVVDAVNYLLSNLPSQAITANVTSGEIFIPTQGQGTSYLYQYINVRYADSPDGVTNFSTSPTNRLYYGLRNTATSTGSSNPSDYVWTQVTGGFGTTKSLFYTTWGGRQITFVVATAAPDSTYEPVLNGVAVDLDIILGTKILANSVGTAQLEDSAVTNVKIAVNAVEAGKIAANAITAGTIAANAVTAGTIAANAVTAGTIAANTVTAINIVSGTITTTQIAANTITGNNIAANSITADKLAANAITANTVVSTGATLGNVNSPGFWLDGTTGNARFGNSLSVGNFLSVGNNASIGGNLAVTGLITSGNLVANAVITTTIQKNAVTTSNAVSDLATEGFDSAAEGLDPTNFYYWINTKPDVGNIANSTANAIHVDVTTTEANTTCIITGSLTMLPLFTPPGAGSYISTATIKYINLGNVSTPTPTLPDIDRIEDYTGTTIPDTEPLYVFPERVLTLPTPDTYRFFFEVEFLQLTGPALTDTVVDTSQHTLVALVLKR